MLNMAGRRIPYFLAMLPFDWLDSPKGSSHTARSFYLEANENETGWDRLYNMYSIDEFGNKSPEMNSVVQGASFGTLVGVLAGGFLKSRVEYLKFVERNDATKFNSVFEAQKKLQDTVTLSFARGAFSWGWRLGLFTGSYILISTSIAAYRGESSILEYMVAGGVSGTLYKTNLGPKGMLVGGLVGGVFGAIAGTISLVLLRMSGTTMEEIRYWQYNWKKKRDQHIEGTHRQLLHDTPIEQAHDKMVEGNKELIPDSETDGKVESKTEIKVDGKT